jgi:NAD kinase
VSEPRTEARIVLIVRRTRLDELIARFNTELQARFYIEHLGADFSDYKAEHEVYTQQLATAQRILGAIGRLHTVDRAFVPNYVFGARDLVVALGQDGLVANVLKYLREQPLVGVNPEPTRWEGVLLPFSVQDLERVVPELLLGRRRICEVTLAKAELNTGERLYAVNDLFVGTKTHGSARYRIEIEDRAENHSSSGVIVSTGVGSTGWLRSVISGASGIVRQLSSTPVEVPFEGRVPWDADHLYFSVREPWPSTTSGAEITFGRITRQRPLKLVSLMAESGLIFSDGVEQDFLQFNAGTAALVTVAERKGRLAV